MASLRIQDYLRAGNSLEKLDADYKVFAKVHGGYPNLVLLKYNQQESDFSQELVRECRGIILDRDRDWAVVSRSYLKFFNESEPHAAPIDWQTAKVFDKADGSLAVLFNYDGKWHVQTSGTPDASGNVNESSLTFKDLFWKTWEKLGYRLPDPEHAQHTFAFELCTPWNRVVVVHKEAKLILHGCRDLTTQQEHAPEPIAARYGWECIKSYTFASMADVVAATKAMKGLEAEGFVVCDVSFARVKIKGEDYLRLAHLRDGVGPRRILDLIRIGEIEEVLAYFEEFRPMAKEIEAKYRNMISDVQTYYETIKAIPVQKEFALEALKHPFNSAMFSVRAGKVKTFEEFFAKMNLRHLGDFLKIKDMVFEV